MKQKDEADPRYLRKVIGANVAARRRTLNLKQEDVGDAVGYNRRWVGNLERGKTGIRCECLPRLLKVLNLSSLDALLKEPD